MLQIDSAKEFLKDELEKNKNKMSNLKKKILNEKHSECYGEYNENKNVLYNELLNKLSDCYVNNPKTKILKINKKQ